MKTKDNILGEAETFEKLGVYKQCELLETPNGQSAAKTHMSKVQRLSRKRVHFISGSALYLI